MRVLSARKSSRDMRSSLISGMTRGELTCGWRSLTVLGIVLDRFLRMYGGVSTEVGPLGMRPADPPPPPPAADGGDMYIVRDMHHITTQTHTHV